MNHLGEIGYITKSDTTCFTRSVFQMGLFFGDVSGRREIITLQGRILVLSLCVDYGSHATTTIEMSMILMAEYCGVYRYLLVYSKKLRVHVDLKVFYTRLSFGRFKRVFC